MSALMVDLGEGITRALNEQTFSLEAKAFRGWRIVEEREAIQDPTITVVVSSKTSQPVSRTQKLHSLVVEATVQRDQNAPSGDRDPVARDDKIAMLTQEIEDFLGRTNISGVGWHATPMRDTKCEVSSERMDLGIFAMKIEVTYQIIL